jgi:hypothetical protein
LTMVEHGQTRLTIWLTTCVNMVEHMFKHMVKHG